MIRPSVAFPGDLGAYSDEAVQAFFEGAATSVPNRDFAEVCDTVEAGTTDYGLLPVENSAVGSVASCYDALVDRDVFVVGEIIRPIRHNLVGIDGTVLADVRRVLSHPMAIAQCARFFATHPRIAADAANDTAGAARQVADLKDTSVAAIAGRLGAERYGLEVLSADVQDRADNETRFLVIARSREGRSYDCHDSERKTIAVFETCDKPGALVAALLPFSQQGINLSKIESRPARGPWAYRFFIEMEAHGPTQVEGAVRDARASTEWFKVLGTYSTRPSRKVNLLHMDQQHEFPSTL